MTTVCEQIIPHLLATELAQLDDGQRPLAIHAAVAYCLAQTMDQFEAQAYLLRAKKEFDLPTLPTLATRLQAEIEAGNGRPLFALFPA